MYHSGSGGGGGVLVIFLGPLSRPTGEKGYVSFRERGVLVIFLGPISRPTGEKGYVSFRELGSTGNLSWATIKINWGEGVCIIQGAGWGGVLVIFLGPMLRPNGEKGYVSFRELGSTGNLSWATIETHLGEGVCIIQGAGEYC